MGKYKIWEGEGVGEVGERGQHTTSPIPQLFLWSDFGHWHPLTYNVKCVALSVQSEVGCVKCAISVAFVKYAMPMLGTLTVTDNTWCANVQSALLDVQYQVCHVKCVVLNVVSQVCNIYCAMSGVLCQVCNVKCAVTGVLSEVCDVKCAVSGVFSHVCSMKCALSNVLSQVCSQVCYVKSAMHIKCGVSCVQY